VRVNVRARRASLLASRASSSAARAHAPARGAYSVFPVLLTQSATAVAAPTVFYLDTSALNQLLDDDEREQVIAYLGKRAVVYVSAINVSEIVANVNATRRLELLKLANRLADDRLPLGYPTDLLRLSLDAYVRRAPGLDVSIDPDSDVWIALRQPERVDERCREGIASHNSAGEESFREMHEKGRDGLQPVVDALSREDRKAIRNASSLCKVYFERPEFLKQMLSELLKEFGHPELAGKEQEFLTILEPWKFYFAAMVEGVYNRGVKSQRYGWRSNAGNLDTHQAIYLAFCDVFVTADAAQRRMLKPVEKRGHKPRHVISYRELRRMALGAP